MSLMLTIAATWTLLAVPVALVVGRALRFGGRSADVTWTDEVEQFLREQSSPRAV